MLETYSARYMLSYFLLPMFINRSGLMCIFYQVKYADIKLLRVGYHVFAFYRPEH